MKSDNYSCVGASHIKIGKPCQDASLSYSDDELGIHIAIVSDGHGGDRYFKSDKGSKLLVEIVKESVLRFVTEPDKTHSDTLIGASLTKVGVPYSGNVNEQDDSLRKLFIIITNRWRKKIAEDAIMSDINEDNIIINDSRNKSEEETKEQKKQLVDNFVSIKNVLANEKDETALSDARLKLAKYYGCTLMAYVQTKNYWFAFHVGDGKSKMFLDDMTVTEPVLWDDNCHLNVTTSMCDDNSQDEFRYTYQGDGNFPVAVFLGSDGMDDSFGDGEKLEEFYSNVFLSLVEEGHEKTKKEIEESLPVISRKGSQDDMSVAYVYDENKIRQHASKLVQKQLDKARLELEANEQKISDLEYKISESEKFINENSSKIGEYEKQCKNASDYIEEQRKSIVLKESEKTELDSKLNQLMIEVRDCEKKISNIKNDIDIHKKQIEKSRYSIADIENKKGLLDKELKKNNQTLKYCSNDRQRECEVCEILHNKTLKLETRLEKLSSNDHSIESEGNLVNNK